MEVLRIGAGAAYAGDRVEPGTDLAARGRLHYLVYECLAERTIALAQLERLKNPMLGFNELLDERFYSALPYCKEYGTKVITNMGAANPIGAAERTCQIIRELRLAPLNVSAVTGDDVLEYCLKNKEQIVIWETKKSLAQLEGEIVSANAYLGADSIVKALQQGADIVITGRCADPSLFLAPMIYEFGWKEDDWNVLGRGQTSADMVECSSATSGGNFADPGYKEVQGLSLLGFPLLEVSPDGEAVVTKLDDTGGLVSVANCTEHMIYEIHDPANYITPDVIVDFTQVKLEQVDKDRVKISGGRGKPRPSELKVSIGIKEGFIGEGEITYAGLGCVERAKLAEQVIRERLEISKIKIEELRVDYIGINSLHGEASLATRVPPYEVRLRFAGRTKNRTDAVRLGNEIETMTGRGPCSPCHPRKYLREVLAIYSCLIPRRVVESEVVLMEVK